MGCCCFKGSSGGASGTFATTDELRAGAVAVEGRFYRTLGQDQAGDGGMGEWLVMSGAGFVDDGRMVVVPARGGSAALALVRVSGAFRTGAVAADSGSGGGVVSWDMRSRSSGGLIMVEGAFVDSFPNNNVAGQLVYDTGSSPSSFGPSQVLGANLNVQSGVIPTGSSGVAGNATVFVNSGVIYIENRQPDPREWLVNVFL